MIIYKTKDGDTLDYICWKHYGHTSGSVEAVLLENRHLEKHDAVLMAGIEIVLPEINTQKQEKTVRLWS
ncbi:MAG: tail protein X [Alphaproteobacteria bacterium]